MEASAASRAPTHEEHRLVVSKHHALVRLSHWLNVPILGALIVSGISIYWASPVFQHRPNPRTGSTDYLADVGIWAVRHVPGLAGSPHPESWIYDHFGLGTFRLADALQLHWFFAYLFMAVGALYFVGLLAGGGWRALLPRRDDIRDALRMIRYYVGLIPAKVLRRPWPHPETLGKYNALQRAAYFSMPVLGTLAVLSGWAMHKPTQLRRLERLFGSYDGARVVHFLVMLAFASFVIPHVILVLADGWDTLRSMIVGWSQRLPKGHDGRD